MTTIRDPRRARRAPPRAPRGLGAALASALALSACEPAHEVHPITARPDGGADAAVASAEFTLQVELGPLPEGGRPRAPLRLQFESPEGDVVESLELPEAMAEAGVHALTAPGPGRWRMRVFYDRDRDGQFAPCPYPPASEDTERADQFDNVFGTVERAIDGGERVAVHLERRLCGPGEADTGVRGELRPPPGADLAGVPVWMELAPEPELPSAMQIRPHDRHDAAAEPAFDEPQVGPVLRLPLFPSGLTRVGAFDLGDLLPGAYRATFYADADGDGLATPCLQPAEAGAPAAFGGGDRYLARADLTIEAGTRAELPTLHLAAESVCPEALTGLKGTVDLAPALVAALDDSPLEGPLRWALLTPETGMPAAGGELLPDIAQRPRPFPFTRTNLPAGDWRVAVYLDVDGDGLYGPCGGLTHGIDQVFALRDQVPVREGVVHDLGPLELARAPECEDTGALAGRLRVELEDGPVGSGRPLRLELYPGDAAGERRSVPVFENHARLAEHADADGRVRFIATPQIPPGRYQARLYVDTDRDGTYASCRHAPFADRASSELFAIEVQAGALIETGDHELALEGCPVPEVVIAPTVAIAEALIELLDVPAPLRLSVTEAGGWSRDERLRGRVVPDSLPYEAPAIDDLAPGLWRLTAYLDLDGDERYGDCAAEVPDLLGGTVEVLLDAASPHAMPQITLDRVCR